VEGQLVSGSLTLAPFTSQILVMASGDLPPSPPPATSVNLTIKTAGEGSGTVTANAGLGSGANCGTTCVESYTPGSQVTLTATPDVGSTFGGWSGSGCSESFTINNSMTCTATFNSSAPLPSEYRLTVGVNGSGKGKVVTKNPTGIDDCTIGTCSNYFPRGKTVILSANAAAASVFSNWSGACSGTEPTTTVTMDADKSCTANFDSSSITYTLTLSKQGEGLVTSDPEGIQCGNTCAKDYPIGTVVKLTATLAGQSNSFSWAGDDDCHDGEVILTTDVSCEIIFTEPQRPILHIDKNGDGNGTVTDNNNLNCGTTCTQTYPLGSTVELTAIADPDSDFAGWTGENCADSFIIENDMNCTAVFELKDIGPPIPENYPLTVQLSGTDHGKVQSNPSGIDCDPQCTENYPIGTSVTLIALPAENFTFIGWEGDCQGTDGDTAVVMMDEVKNCTAQFAPARYTLTLTKQGKGTIIIQPNNLPCEDICVVFYPRGSIITLQPVVKGNTRLTAFKGDPDCQDGQITLDKDIQCEAIFETIKPVKAPLCPLNGIIDYVCNGRGNPITDVTIEENGQVSNVKLVGQAINRGRFSNATIEASGTLRGGIVSGYIINHGTMQDFDFRGGNLSGGNLAGSITSTGTLEDVSLAPGTEIQGGYLAKTVTGDPTNFAILEDLEVQSGAELTNVIIGDNVELPRNVTLTNIEFRGKTLQGVTLSGLIQNSEQSILEDVNFRGDVHVIGGKLGGKIKGNGSQQIQLEQLEIQPGSELSQVLIGPNVIFPKELVLKDGIQFTDVQAIPLELELSEILPTLPVTPGDCVVRFSQPKLVDLTATLFPGKPSILEMINEIPDVQERGWQFNQDGRYGYLLQVEPDNSWIALQPWSIKRTTIATAQMQVTEQQTTMFITNTGLEILAQPAVTAACELQADLKKLKLPTFIMQPNGNVTVPVSKTFWYSARPDWITKEITDLTSTGINFLSSPLVGGTFLIQQVFIDPDGNQHEQLFYPAVTNPEALDKSVDGMIMEANGVVTFTLAGKNHHGVVDYAVTKDKATTNTLEISTIPDSNGDGQEDWQILYPTGERQKIFAIPANN
jgi:hypothetical protein